MPTLEGLQLAANLGKTQRESAVAREQTQRRQDVVPIAAEKFKAGDVKGAYMTLAAADPEWAMQLQYSLQPKADPLALLNRKIEGQKEVAGMRNSGQAKLKDQKDDSWTTQVYGKVTSSQPYKNFQDFKLREASLLNAAENPSAYGDIAAVFGFMKALDPQSVVRESEYATAANAGSLLTRAKNAVAKAEKGEQLTPEQRSDLVRITKHLSSVYKKNYEDHISPIRNQATKRGVSMDFIDPYDARNQAKAAPAAPSGPKVGEVMDGFQYIGGDPADPKSWKKQ